MISVLIVEDDETKASRVTDVISSATSTNLEIVNERTVVDAKDALSKCKFDLLILDLQIPIRQGSRPDPEGGHHILELIRKDKSLFVPQHIVGLTSFTDLEEDYLPDFNQDHWRILKYDVTTSDWEKELSNQVSHIAKAKKFPLDGYGIDLAIVTALVTPELSSILDLPADWKKVSKQGDDTIYHIGEFNENGKSLTVVACAAVEMGMVAATAISMKVIQQFRPRFLAMTGICAGLKGNYGDVIATDQVWDYSAGKIARKYFQHIFQPAPSPLSIDKALRNLLVWYKDRNDINQLGRTAWTGPSPNGAIEIQVGPTASGPFVLQSKKIMKQLFARNRKLRGVEMEVYGVFHASENSTEPRPAVFALKSICDFGDSKKHDDWQAFAAHSSARILYAFSLQELSPKNDGIQA